MRGVCEKAGEKWSVKSPRSLGRNSSMQLASKAKATEEGTQAKEETYHRTPRLHVMLAPCHASYRKKHLCPPNSLGSLPRRMVGQL